MFGRFASLPRLAGAVARSSLLPSSSSSSTLVFRPNSSSFFALASRSFSSVDDFTNVDLYRILGLHRTADINDIKAAYRELAKVYHPDSGKIPDEEVFTRVTEAYKILSNPSKKTEYDLSRYRRIATYKVRNEGGLSDEVRMGAKGYSGSEEDAFLRSDVHPLHESNTIFQSAVESALARFRVNARMRGQARRLTREKLFLPSVSSTTTSLLGNAFAWFVIGVILPLCVALLSLYQYVEDYRKAQAAREVEMTMEI